MDLNNKPTRLPNLLRIGIYLFVMIVLLILVLPDAWGVIRDNIRALQIIQCDKDHWIQTAITEADPVEVALWARTCSISLEDQDVIDALENALVELPENPLLSAQYARLYWRMGMREQAFHQLNLARASSGSLRWTAFLAGTNLGDVAFEGYVASRWWSARRVCDEIYASAEAAPKVSALADLVTYCENSEP